MATRVSLSSRPDLTDRAVVEKVKLTNDAVDRRAEAQWLADARHTGVVRLLTVSEDPFTICTEHAGTATLRTERLGPVDAARTLTQVAETLASLHERSLVHGKISLDHVILGEAGPVLCSPAGTVHDPLVDVAGLGRCVRDLIERWAEEDGALNPQSRAVWEEAARALSPATEAASSEGVSSVRRAARLLERLGDGPGASVTSASPSPLLAAPGRAIGWRTRSLVALAVVLVVTLTGALLTEAETASDGSGSNAALVDIHGRRFAVGEQGDSAIALERPCHGVPGILVLRRSDATVWRFDDVSDQAQGQPVARVPGATALVVTAAMPEAEQDAETDGVNSSTSCEHAWARGPAGQTEIR